MTDSKGPTRGYSWPPFEPGNTVAVQHGAYSARFVAPRAAEILAELFAIPDLPEHLRRPEFRPALADWADQEARNDLRREWLSNIDTSKPTPRVLAAMRELDRGVAYASKLRDAAGLTPVSAAKLSRDVSASRFMATQMVAGIERLAATGAQLAARDLAAIEAARTAVVDDEGGTDVEQA